MSVSRAPSAAPTALSESVASVGGDAEPILAQHQGSPTQGFLLPFHRSIIRGLIPNDEQPLEEGDALLIMARGLGLRRVIACVLKVYDSPRNLVLVVNATSDEEAGLREELTRLHSKEGLRSVSYDMTAKQRDQLYLKGGLISITSRILIVDMLNKTIPTEMITGLVILHAEHVSPNSTEAFIVRVYRQVNQYGFLKAFSDEPEHFSLGFSPLRTVLTQLQISKVELWPRFHESVKRDVGDLDAPGKKKAGKSGANVVQVYQPLSQAQTDIQGAIVECLDATLAELKKGTKEVNIEDYTFENSLFKSFDSLVRSQLGPIWHRVGFKTRQLVYDLGTLRLLLQHLLSDDPVTFLQYLETIIAMPNPSVQTEGRNDRSAWLGLDAANTMITKAKARVYSGRITAASAQQALIHSVTAAVQGSTAEEDEEEAMMEAHDGPSGSRHRSRRPAWLPPGIEPVLDELPKWHALRDIMDEIEQEIHFQSNDLTGSTNNTILIMVDSDRTCHQVREFLSTMDGTFVGATEDEQEDKPANAMMRRLFRRYMIWKSGLGNMKSNVAQAVASAAMAAKTASNINDAFASNDANGSAEIESAALKRKAESGRGRQPPEKRRRQRGGAAGGGPGRLQKTTIAEAGQEAEDLAAFTQRALEQVAADIDDGSDDSDIEFLGGSAAEAAGTGVPEDFTEIEFDEYFGLLSMENLVVVRPYDGDNDDNVLQELRPRYVVMYDASTPFTRRLEVYRALNPTTALRSYFVIYRASAEEQRFLSGTRREKESFERLIREKSTMALTINSDGRPGPQDASSRRYVRTISSRAAGGQRASDEAPRIIVDVREFRSSLPSMLHLAGIQVVPLTLQVGDYILSPTICVERKSLPDLVQSFNSGRLYSQCELMSIHYEHPVLLIEFEENKSFSLESLNEKKKVPKGSFPARSTPSDMDTQAKLVLLTITFPRLRVVWSSSPLATADIFTELKSTYEEPDEKRVAGLGLEEGEGEGTGGGAAGGEGVFNLAAQDMLRAMPGVSTKTYRHVMNQVRDLKELCTMQQNEAQHVIGSEPAKTLSTFAHKDYTQRAR